MKRLLGLLLVMGMVGCGGPKPSGEELQTLTGHVDFVLNVAFSPDGQRIVSGGGKTVKIWDASE